jgi:PKD repeat protein
MKLLVKIFWSVVVVSVICTVIAICFVQNPLLWMHGRNNDQSEKLINIMIPNGKISLGSFAATGSISIHAPEPEVPQSVPIYKGIIKHGDNLTVMTGNLKELLREKTDVTSEKDAPSVAVKALEQYGGLPADAVLSISKTNYAEYYDRSTWEVVDRRPIMTTVAFNRMIQVMPVVGQCDGIMVDLGENDTVLSISKIWRSLEYAGKNTSVISPEKAIDKIRNGESIDPSFDVDSIQIYTITLGYYERSRTEPEITLEPVWVFSGNTTPKSPVKIIVYARQFANFTATPTNGKVPLAVTFTDTSDATPIQWYWDLGDGTNSTEQNPSHLYTTAGTYNVSLKAWNDLGSDAMEKTGYITVSNTAPPVANFTATPTPGNVPLTDQFNDTSSNIPTGWLWEFGDRTNSTK